MIFMMLHLFPFLLISNTVNLLYIASNTVFEFLRVYCTQRQFAVLGENCISVEVCMLQVLLQVLGVDSHISVHWLARSLPYHSLTIKLISYEMSSHIIATTATHMQRLYSELLSAFHMHSNKLIIWVGTW